MARIEERAKLAKSPGLSERVAFHNRNGLALAAPERILQNPYRANKALPRNVKRPNRLKMLLTDPTECADSSRIIPAVMKWFPDAEIRPTGDAIYHLALNNVLHNMDEAADRDTIQKSPRIDDLYTSLGQFHYAVAVADKKDLDVA